MSLLEITGLTHAFGDQTLYRNAELALNKGEHIGIVGQNGSGKSTLIRICTGQVIPDGGRVSWQPGITYGYLDQYAQTDGEITMGDFLRSAFRHLYQTEERMNRLYARAAEGDEKAMEAAFQCQEELELEEFYMIDTRLAQVAGGLGLTALGMERRLGEMSGGQRARVILAKLLLEQPDVLLLDEPTNFLDREHIEWLAGWLAELKNAFLVVSHDSSFLERAANRICDIDQKVIRKYYGSYGEFSEKKRLLQEDYARQYAAQQREIRKTEEFIRRNIAGRKSKMAKGRRKQLKRMDRLEALSNTEIRPAFQFCALPFTETEHLAVKGLAVGYGSPLLSGIHFSLKGGTKAVITGFNGIGKTTLLKTLTGELKAAAGEVKISNQVKIAYFEQELRWRDGETTPLALVSDADRELTEKEARAKLARCGVSALHARQPIETLSGGEQSKVKLCLLSLKPCNFLILDEPTNHLDALSKDALRDALEKFPGTVLLVSHEKAFYRRLADQVIELGK